MTPDAGTLTHTKQGELSDTFICMACGAWQEEGEEYRELVIGGEPCVLCPTCYPAAAGIVEVCR